MKYDFTVITDELSKKYTPLIHEKKYWNGESVQSFFELYRETITNLFKEYPKFYYDGIFIPVGLTEDDLPFEKELIQGKIFKELFSSEILLFPRYVMRTFSAIFNIQLSKGSIGDGLVALSGDKFLEFKLCTSNKIPRRITEASQVSDMFFICAENIDEQIQKKLITGRRKVKMNTADFGYLFDLSSLNLFKVEKNKEIQGGPPHLFYCSPERIRGGRTDNSELPTAIKLYSDSLLAVNQNSFIDFSAYRRKEAEEYDVETLLLYGGNPDLTDAYKEYHMVANEFAAKNIRVLIPKSYPLKYFDDFPITGVCEFSSETGTRLDYSISATEFAERHGLKHYRIELTDPVRAFWEQRMQARRNNEKTGRGEDDEWKGRRSQMTSS